MKQNLLLLVIICIYSTSFSQKKKLLIIGLDGCGADVINKEYSPTMNSIFHLSNTAYSYKMINERLTMSATNWSSMLTDVHWRKHKAKK
ncbi:MAG: alkaline phosphatase family protein [Bacteroidetes bacterium]|nr:alkaline phosphatase family protein [Bacteroidota bacterium]